jgi:hypothetical protein
MAMEQSLDLTFTLMDGNIVFNVGYIISIVHAPHMLSIWPFLSGGKLRL